MRPQKQDKQAKLSPTKGLAARLHAQAGELPLNTAASENEDVLVLSDDESDQDAADEDAVLADASLSLVGPPKSPNILACQLNLLAFSQ